MLQTVHFSRKYFPKRGPEARLYGACCAAILFPAGMFIYAWSSFPQVSWVALVIGITVSRVGVCYLNRSNENYEDIYLGHVYNLPGGFHVPS